MTEKRDPLFFGSCGFLYNPLAKEVLLHKRDHNTLASPGKWSFFGGSVQDDETPQQTFIRELREELTFSIDEESARPLTDYYVPEHFVHRYVFFAESQVPKQELVLTEGEDCAWIPLEKVFEYDLTRSTERDLHFFISRLASEK